MDVILTIVVLSFWVLFPIGLYLAISKIDKSTDHVIHLAWAGYENFNSR